jgi:sugar lactone lactonase YvrE
MPTGGPTSSTIGSPVRTPSRRLLAALVALSLLSVPAGAAAAGDAARPDPGADGRIDTVAGSAGRGHATDIGMDVASVASGGGALVVGGGAIVRRLLPETRQQYPIAGTGGGGSPADGGPATMAGLAAVSAVAVAGDGSVLLADLGAAVIRRVRGGVITTVAGTGVQGGGGDGGPARDAELFAPEALVVAPDGAILVADSGTASVRRIDAAGTIRTIVGTGTPGSTGDGGPASQAALHRPEALALDPAGRLYIADAGAHRIRRVDLDGTITTVAGTGTSGFSGDGGSAARATLAEPAGVLVAPDGALLVADTANHRVRRIGADGVIRTIAGNDGAGFHHDGADVRFATLWRPRHLALHDGELYIADQRNLRVRRLTTAGTVTTVLGNGTSGWSGDGGPAVDAQLASPFAVDLAPDGSLLVADSHNHRVRRIAPDGRMHSLAGGADWFAEDSGDGGPASRARLRLPFGVAVGPDGAVFVSEHQDSVIRRIDPDGSISTYAGSWTAGDAGDGGAASLARLRRPHGLAVTADGSLYVADTGNHRVRRVSPAGVITTVAGTGAPGFGGDGGPATAAALDHPVDVAVGSEGTVYIADSNNGRIRAVAGGRIRTVGGSDAHGLPACTGDGGPATEAALTPDGVAVDSAGRVYVADRPGTVRRIDRDGTIRTVAGDGTPSLGGDGGPPALASLSWPRGLAVAEGAGRTDVYVADWGNARVRRISGAAAVPCVARLAGRNRLETAVAVSTSGFDDLSAGAVVLARGDTFPDALAGAPLAAALGGPLLLTSPDRLDAVPEAEIRRVLRAGEVVHLLGGERAVGPEVRARLEALGYRVVRHAGSDRYATAARIAEELGRPELVILTTGSNFPDAVSAGAVAAARGGVVLLTAGNSVPPATQALLDRHPRVPRVAIGGPAARAVPSAEPVVGADRFATAARVAERFFPRARAAGVASGTSFPDALTGGAQIGGLDGPLLLMARDTVPPATGAYLAGRGGDVRLRVYGGAGVVTAEAVTALSRGLRP